jgi:hypothetical protein
LESRQDLPVEKSPRLAGLYPLTFSPKKAEGVKNFGAAPRIHRISWAMTLTSDLLPQVSWGRNEVGVERGSAGCPFWWRFLVPIFTPHLQTEAVLSEIQNRS